MFYAILAICLLVCIIDPFIVGLCAINKRKEMKDDLSCFDNDHFNSTLDV